MRRALLGIIGVLLVVGGIALPFAGFDASWTSFGAGVLVKTGAVTLLFWLAYHQVLRLFEVVPPWMMGAAVVGVIAIIAHPKSLLLVLALFAGLLVLHFAGMFLTPFLGKTRKASVKRPGVFKGQLPNFKSQISDFRSETSNLKSEIGNHKSEI